MYHSTCIGRYLTPLAYPLVTKATLIRSEAVLRSSALLKCGVIPGRVAVVTRGKIKPKTLFNARFSEETSILSPFCSSVVCFCFCFFCWYIIFQERKMLHRSGKKVKNKLEHKGLLSTTIMTINNWSEIYHRKLKVLFFSPHKQGWKCKKKKKSCTPPLLISQRKAVATVCTLEASRCPASPSELCSTSGFESKLVVMSIYLLKHTDIS